MISYGPFMDAVRARNGLNHLIAKKLGVTRAENMGIVWQDGAEVQFLQQPRPHPNGYAEMMHITADHVRKPPPKLDDVSNSGLAWNALNTVGDAAVTYLSYTAFTAAIGVAIDAAAMSGIAAGTVFMLSFLGVEVLDAAVLLLADGIMTVLSAVDRATGMDLAHYLKHSAKYNFIETWGPIIALPAVAHDIFLAFNIPRDARLLSDLRSQMLARAKTLLREMCATEAFIGGEGDLAARSSYEFLKKSVHELGENLADIKRDFRKLAIVGMPADVVGLINDEINWSDIESGAMADLTAMDVWMQQGFDRAAHAAEGWTGAAETWLRAGTARATISSPRRAPSAYSAARFGGIYSTVGNPKLTVHSLFPITMHLLGGTRAKPLKAKR